MDQNNNQERIRVLRLIEYEGPRHLVEKQVEKSVHGTRLGIRDGILDGGRYVRITAVTLGIYPEIIEDARAVPAPGVVDELHITIRQLQAELKRAVANLDDYENPGREVSET